MPAKASNVRKSKLGTRKDPITRKGVSAWKQHKSRTVSGKLMAEQKRLSKQKGVISKVGGATAGFLGGGLSLFESASDILPGERFQGRRHEMPDLTDKDTTWAFRAGVAATMFIPGTQGGRAVSGAARGVRIVRSGKVVSGASKGAKYVKRSKSAGAVRWVRRGKTGKIVKVAAYPVTGPVRMTKGVVKSSAKLAKGTASIARKAYKKIPRSVPKKAGLKKAGSKKVKRNIIGKKKGQLERYSVGSDTYGKGWKISYLKKKHPRKIGRIVGYG